MATKVYKFHGISEYAKVHQVDQLYGHYGLNLFMDKPSMELFKKTGLRLKVKDKDGKPYVGFRRHPDKVFEGQNPKPEVTDSLGRPIEDLIGNGSKVSVTISVYDTARYGKGHRLEAVQVNELVPYNGGVEDAHADYNEDGDYVEEPVEAAPPKRQGQKPNPAKDNDELPF